MTDLPGPQKLSEPPFELREKIAQLMFVRIGSNLPPIRTVEDDRERILEIFKLCPIGGLLLFNGGRHTKESLQQLQSASKYLLLVAADMERGVGQQIHGYTIFPHAMAFRRQPTSIETFVDVVAREAHDAGVHITFGPVADVNTNPRNPIVSIRAFSENPQVAAEMTAAYVAAAESRGLMSTAKHFPGHGDTHQDSHESLPVVERTLDELRACELRPFQAAVDAGCSLVMTAHVAFPKIDPSGAPATLSPILLANLLRREMGFKGTVCSDSLLMAGVHNRFASEGEMALATLNTGVDMLLDIHDPTAVVDYLEDCVGNGSLLEARVDEACQRVWALKQKVLDRPEPSASGKRSQLAKSHAMKVARMAIEILNATEPKPLPFDIDQPLAAILLKPFELPSDPPEQPLADALRKRFRDVMYLQLGPRADTAQFAAAEQLAHKRSQVLVAMIVKPAAWHAFGLLPAQREFVERLTQERSVVLACLGMPYALRDYPQAQVHICTYSDVPVSQQALAEFVAM